MQDDRDHTRSSDESSNGDGAELVPFVPQPFDLTLPVEDRMVFVSALLDHFAALSVERDEKEVALAREQGDKKRLRDLPWVATQQERKAEIARRKLKSIVELGEICNMLEVSWADENDDQVWLDEDGNETTLEVEVEKLMPNEEQRDSSGRARQVAGFRKTMQAMRKVGVPDAQILRAAKKGQSSRLGILRHAQKEIDKRTQSDEQRKALYEKAIDVAVNAKTVEKMKKAIAQVVDPDAPPPALVRYSCEAMGDLWWVAMIMTHDQFSDVFMGSLGGEIELSTTPLFGELVTFWRERYG